MMRFTYPSMNLLPFSQIENGEQVFRSHFKKQVLKTCSSGLALQTDLDRVYMNSRTVTKIVVTSVTFDMKRRNRCNLPFLLQKNC